MELLPEPKKLSDLAKFLRSLFLGSFSMPTRLFENPAVKQKRFQFVDPMLDCFSDSELLNGKQHSSDLDTEGQLLEEQKNIKLQQENESLMKETSILRAQFESAVGLTKKMDDLHAKNVKLSAEARSLQAEKEELERRLEIALRANQDLTGQLASEKQGALQRQAQEQTQREEAMVNTRKQFECEIEKLTQELKKSESDKEKSALKLRQIESRVQHLVQNAEQYFERKFESIDDLVKLLGLPKLSTPEERTVIRTVGEVESLKAKVKKQKACLKQSKKERERLVGEMKKLQKDFEVSTKKYETQIKKMAAKHADFEEEQNTKTTSDQKLITELKMKNDALTAEVTGLKRTLKEINDRNQEQSLQEKTKMVVSISELKKADPTRAYQDKIQDLKENVSTLTQKLSDADDKKRELTQSLAKSEKAVDSLGIELEKTKGELAALQLVHQETQNEIQCLRNSLHAKDASQPDRKEVRLSKCLKAKVAQMDHTIKSQAQQIHELSLKNEKDKQDIEKLEQRNEQMKAEVSDSRQKMEQLVTELGEARLRLQDTKTVTADDVMPVHAWKATGFDPELAQQIDQLAMNSLLQPSTKITQIYRAISKYYSQIIADKDEKAKKAKEEVKRIQQIVNQVCVDISLGLSLPAISFEDLIERGGDQKIVAQIKETAAALDAAQRRSHQLGALTDHIVNMFGQSDDMFAQITEVKQALDGLDASLKRKVRTCKALKKKLKDAKATSTQQIEDLLNEKGELESSLHDLKKEFDGANATILKLKNELLTVRQEYKEFVNSTNDKEAERSSAHRTDVESLRNEHARVESQLNSAIQKLNSEITNASSIIQEHESNIAKLRKALQLAQTKIEEKEAAYAELQEAKQKEIRQLQNQYTTEKTNLTDSYEKALEELQQQCDAHRNDLEKVSVELADSKKTNCQAKKALTSLKREKAKLESELTSLQERMEREQALNKAAVKNAQLTADNTITQKLQDAKNKAEVDKRRIFSYAADEFRTLFNATENIDERSFRALINKASSELKRLSESDSVIRRLIGAAPRQSTDDAVAQLVMNNTRA